MKEEINLNKIKENLYSRQIGTYGEDFMQKILNLNVLILGLKGLGVEICKNIILSGPKSVLIYDPSIAKLEDLGNNYYLKYEDINKNRLDYSILNSLSNLNPFTKVDILNLINPDNFFDVIKKQNLNVIVQTEIQSKDYIIQLNDFCRKNNIKFIYGAVLGLGGFIFSDFGNNHIIFDKNGIEPRKYFCKNITNTNKCLVSVVEEFSNPFRLETDDYIIFKNVKGIIELNDNKPRKILINDNYSFFIEDDATNYHKFEGNGDIYEYKFPIVKNYLSFEESINIPFHRVSKNETFTEQDEIKPNTNILYLSIILSLKEYLNDKTNDRFKINNEEEIQKILKKSEIKFNQIIEHDQEIGIFYEGFKGNEIKNFDKNLAKNFIKFSHYKIIPMCSLIGGYISQEIIKIIGKYDPLNQWLFFDLYDNNYNYAQISNNKILNYRYLDQISIFGQKIHEKLQNLNIFISGAGAVGCELLKNLALMGVH